VTAFASWSRKYDRGPGHFCPGRDPVGRDLFFHEELCVPVIKRGTVARLNPRGFGFLADAVRPDRELTFFICRCWTAVGSRSWQSAML
jgi:hypothetical protein